MDTVGETVLLASAKKGKKKSKNMATIKVSGDSWQNQMEDEDHYDDYGDDFM